MGATQFTKKQIASVDRDDFDTTTAGKAVITKIVAGTGVTINSTGVDAGTGDVTINATGGGGGAGTWTFIKKSADQSKASNITLAADNDLFFSMAANTRYLIRLSVFYDTSANADFKFGIIGPASPTLVRIQRQWQLPGATVFAGIAVDTSYPASLALAGTGTNGGYIYLEGIVHTGAASGTFGFQWAQNGNDVASTIVRAGSYIQYMTV